MVEASESGKPVAQSGRLMSGMAVILTVAAVLGVIWTVVQFWNPIKERDVTVVFEEHRDFSLPKEASSLNKLTMTYDGHAVPHVSLVRLSVVNSGNLPVEPPEGLNEWILALRSRQKLPLEVVGDPVSTPGVSVAIQKPPDQPEVVHLKLGMLKTRESVTLQLAMIGGKGEGSGIEVEEAGKRIGDLRLAKASTSVRHRIMNAFLPPALVLSVLVLVALGVWEYRRGSGAFNKPLGPAALLGNIAGMLFIGFFSSVFLAAGLSWLLSWLVYLVAFR
jgi:hypothetical protein